MVPRTYLYSSPSPTKMNRDQEKQGAIDMSVEHYRKSNKAGKKEKAKMSAAPPKMFTPAPPTPSKPVVIPTKTRNGGRRQSTEPVGKEKRWNADVAHDASSTPPSMAALLAMSGHSEPERRHQSSALANRSIQNAKLRDTPTRTISSSSPQSWNVLLTPPETNDPESSSFESDTTLGPLSSGRSLSTDSMPSLDTDTESLNSASNPATPAFQPGSRTGSDRRQKSLSTSVSEDCVFDHPLLSTKPQTTLQDDPPDEPNNLLAITPSPLARSKFYFKSNLTASFRKIRSAAQSFSAFTTPPTQREDYLARSLLSLDSQFTDERRPLPSIDPPDPALRRYLNPIKFSPAELHFHSEESPQVARPSCTASIQLQTYRRRNRTSDKASSPPIFDSAQQKALDAVDGLPQISSPRQREPRENSDFLRVIVLEMNMRKKGKLDDASPGRARLWLPARQSGKIVEGSGSEGEETKTPARWVGIHA